MFIDLKTKPENLSHKDRPFLHRSSRLCGSWSKLEEGFQESLQSPVSKNEPKKTELIHPRMASSWEFISSFLQSSISSFTCSEWIVGKEFVSIFLDWQNVHPLVGVPSVDYRGRKALKRLSHPERPVHWVTSRVLILFQFLQEVQWRHDQYGPALFIKVKTELAVLINPSNNFLVWFQLWQSLPPCDRSIHRHQSR